MNVDDALLAFVEEWEVESLLGLFSEHQIVEIVRNALDDAYNAETYRLIKEAA